MNHSMVKTEGGIMTVMSEASNSATVLTGHADGHGVRHCLSEDV